MDTKLQHPLLPIIPDTLPYSAARIVSRFFGPPILGLASGAVAAIWLGAWDGWLWAAFFVLPAVFIPVWYVLHLMRQGKVTDFDVYIREQRWRSYLMSIGVGVFLLTIAFFLHAPFIFLAIGSASLIQTLLLFLTNMKWKISAHCATAAGFAVLCWRLWDGWAILFLMFIPLMVWSRVLLRRHTFWQSVTGASLGAGMFFLAMALVI
jgi:membrane-associated phospholipid phosphatase